MALGGPKNIYIFISEPFQVWDSLLLALPCAPFLFRYTVKKNLKTHENDPQWTLNIIYFTFQTLLGLRLIAIDATLCSFVFCYITKYTESALKLALVWISNNRKYPLYNLQVWLSHHLYTYA